MLWETFRVSVDGAGAAEHVVLRVSLVGSDAVVWRQLSAAGDLTLDRVHEVFQATLGWEDVHLHRFTAKDPYERITENELEQGWPPQWVPAEFVEEDYDRPEEEMTLSALLEAGRGVGFYEYDFGDSWLHLIETIGHEPARRAPVWLIAGKSACPPEDCGGIDSYLDLVDALADPADVRHAGALEWAGGHGWGPGAFDREAAVADLAAVLRRWKRRRRP